MISKSLKNLLILCFFISIISNCSYKKYTNLDSQNINLDTKTISLEVSSYRVNNQKAIDSQEGTEIYNFEKSLRSNFNNWANRKFIPVGKKNKAVLHINKVQVILKNTTLNKGIKKIISFEEKKEYLILLEIILSFTDGMKNSVDLNIKGEVDFFIQDNTSINDREKLLNKSISKLLLIVDQSIENNLNKDTFVKFYRSTNY